VGSLISVVKRQKPVLPTGCIFNYSTTNFWGIASPMSDVHHRTCACGAVYSRTESSAPGREINSFECKLCDRTMETWNSAWVPTYKFLAGPVRR
jgi:hypothetical protein